MNKRIKFLNEVIEQLGLTGIETVHGRAEDFAKPGKLREKYDLCVSRAVANLSTLSEYCLPYVKVGGKFIPYKSEKMEEEMNNMTLNPIQTGFKFERVNNWGGFINRKVFFVRFTKDYELIKLDFE